MRRTDGELILFWTLPALAIIWVSAFFLFPGFLHPDVADHVRGAGRELLSRRDRADSLQHDPVQLVRRGSDPHRDPLGDADPPDGSSHADPVLQPDRLRRRPTRALPHRQHVLAPRRLPPGTRPRADPVAQRSRVGHLHHPGSLSDRSMPAAGAGDLLGSPGPTGFQTVGGTFQSARRGRAGTCGLRRADAARACGMGWAVVLLGQEHRDRRLDRRHGSRSRPDHPAAAQPRTWSRHEYRDIICAGIGDAAGPTRGFSSEPVRLELPSPSQARVVVRVVGDAHLLQPVRTAVLRRHPRPAAAEPGLGHPRGRALVQRPPPRASRRIRRGLPGRRHVCADERSACVLDAAHVGESDLRLLVPGHVCAQRGARHAGDGHRDDRWRPAAGHAIPSSSSGSTISRSCRSAEPWACS